MVWGSGGRKYSCWLPYINVWGGGMGGIARVGALGGRCGTPIGSMERAGPPEAWLSAFWAWAPEAVWRRDGATRQCWRDEIAGVCGYTEG